MSKKLGFGIIGCGLLGQLHAEALSRIPGVKLIGFCNRSIEKAEVLRVKYGGEIATRDPAVLIEHAGTEVVLIATHHDSHVPLSLAAIAANKHIVVEKPLALEVRDCIAVVNAIRASSVRCMVAYKLRYYPAVQRAHALIAQPRLLSARMIDDPWPSSSWAQNPHTGGGNILSQGGHMVDLLCHLSNSRPVEVQAAAANFTHPDDPYPDHLTGLIRFENGCMGVWVQGDGGCLPHASKFSFEMIDANGRTAEVFSRLKHGVYRIGQRIEEMERTGEEGLFLQDSEFVRDVLDGRPPSCGVADGLMATLVMRRCLRAAKMGSSVPIQWCGELPVLAPEEGVYTC